MGLDQYAERRDSNGESTELSYWRKHNALQGWMEKLWTLKTGKPANELNCQDLELTAEDLKNLKSAVINGDLPETLGFFFGADSSQDETRKEEELQFISEAMDAINEGDKVLYSCWW